LRLFSFGGYELALAALTLVVFGAYNSYPYLNTGKIKLDMSQYALAFLELETHNSHHKHLSFLVSSIRTPMFIQWRLNA